MKRILIINALIWAAVILIASYLYKDSENYEFLFGVLLTGAGLQNGFTYEMLKKSKRD